MFKTGLAGQFTKHDIEAIVAHPGFEVTGLFVPDNISAGNKIIQRRQIPALCSESLLKNNEALIFSGITPWTINLLSNAIKRSKHIMLLDTSEFPSESISEIIKLTEEAQSVIQIRKIERSNPVLKACLPLVVHPSLTDIKLLVSESECRTKEAVAKNLLKILDVIMFLNPANVKKIHTIRQPSQPSASYLISARIDFESGSAANLLFSNMSERKYFNAHVYHKSNQLDIDIDDQKLRVIEPSGDPNKKPGKRFELKQNLSKVMNNELDSFHNSIVQQRTSSNELYHLLKITGLGFTIFDKSGIA